MLFLVSPPSVTTTIYFSCSCLWNKLLRNNCSETNVYMPLKYSFRKQYFKWTIFGHPRKGISGLVSLVRTYNLMPVYQLNWELLPLRITSKMRGKPSFWLNNFQKDQVMPFVYTSFQRHPWTGLWWKSRSCSPGIPDL